MIILTEENFESEVLKSEIPVLVDFYADWCGPCQMMGPILEDMEIKDMKDMRRMKIGKVNVDQNQALAEKYGVMSIPTLIFFNKGEVVKTLVGGQTKETLQSLLRLDAGN